MNKNMLMKWFVSFIIVLSCFHVTIHDAFCSETYYIDNDRVLLYKIINWWYDCLPEESKQICGRPIKCQSKSNLQVEYNEVEMILKLQVNGSFADLLSIFKQCDRCFGPSYLKCTWLNNTYFGNGDAAIVSNKLPIRALIVNNIEKKHGWQIQRIEKDIVFVIEGVIGGLMNGKIALHQAGNFLKTCPEASESQGKIFPISLKIINSNTKEVLIKYSAIFEH